MFKKDKQPRRLCSRLFIRLALLIAVIYAGCGDGGDNSSVDGSMYGLGNSGTVVQNAGGVKTGIQTENATTVDPFTDAPAVETSSNGVDPIEASIAIDGSTNSDIARLNIYFDYRFDSKQAFQNTQRRDLMDTAARAWTRYIMNDFEEVPAGVPVRTRNPEHIDEPGIVFTLQYSIDDIAIMAGYTDIDGPEDVLGWSSLSITTRDMDPALGQRLRERFDGSAFQPWIAQISFDEVENWFYDPTPETDDDIPLNSIDFLGTATHEIGHVLGFATSNAFQALISGETFTGPRAMEIYGGPVPLEPDLNHILRNTEINGEIPVMERGSSAGRRKTPTELDLAILEDIGYIIDWSAF